MGGRLIAVQLAAEAVTAREYNEVFPLAYQLVAKEVGRLGAEVRDASGVEPEDQNDQSLPPSGSD